VDLEFLAFLVVDGALAGAIYALVALAFVVVYKASRMINFAVGEWMMVGSRLVAASSHVLGLGFGAALGAACVGAVAMATVFNRVVLRRLIDRSLLTLIMVTVGLGMFMRGSATLAFAGLPGGIASPLPLEPVVIRGVPISPEKLVAAAIAGIGIAALSWFFHGSRTGLALRAISDDQQMAMAVGIDLPRLFTITWGVVGVVAVLAGTLWSIASGGGFGVELLGRRVFPIVIIGGLDSLPGTIIGAFVVGILESLTAGYVDPLVGGGFSHVAAYLVLIAMLFVRPYGLFGRQAVERV
jgi:branched-chain amino acid transport system permease protein